MSNIKIANLPTDELLIDLGARETINVNGGNESTTIFMHGDQIQSVVWLNDGKDTVSIVQC